MVNRLRSTVYGHPFMVNRFMISRLWSTAFGPTLDEDPWGQVRGPGARGAGFWDLGSVRPGPRHCKAADPPKMACSTVVTQRHTMRFSFDNSSENMTIFIKIR